MKKEKRMRKILAVMLVLVLSVCQLSVVSYAQEEIIQEGFTGSEDPAERLPDVSASENLDEDTGFGSADSISEDSDSLSGEAVDAFISGDSSQNTPDAPVEEKNIEAHLTITPDTENENHYIVEVIWQISGAAESDIRLALAMDQETYAALPQEAKADEQNVCHIKAIDENGAEVTLAMNAEADENDSSIFRLVYTQSGNGTVKIAQNFTLENCEEDHISDISAQWYNESSQWTTLEEAQLQWTKTEPQEIVEPAEEPEANEESETPEVTEIQETDDIPEITEIPEEEAGSEAEDMEEIASFAAPAEDTMLFVENGENRSAILLDDYITAISFRQKNSSGIWETARPEPDGSYVFEKGNQNLEFSLQYKLPAGLVSPENNTVTYDLPEGFNYADEDGFISWGNGNAGTYTIKNGKVTLTFNQDKFFETDTDFTGYITFKSGTSKDASDDKYELKFNDKFDFTYTVKEEDSSGEDNTDRSFNATKKGSEVDGEDHVLSYVIGVTPGKNGATNVVLKDKIEINASKNVDKSKIQFRDITVKNKAGQVLNTVLASDLTVEQVGPDWNQNGLTTITYKTSNGTVIGKVVSNNNGIVETEIDTNYCIVSQNDDEKKNGVYNFYLPDMTKDDSYDITYKADLNNLGLDFNFEKYYSVNNKISDDREWNQKDNDFKEYGHTWISKKLTGSQTDENGNYVLNWKIDINPEHDEMQAGDVFKDELKLPTATTGCTNSVVTVVIKDEKNGEIKRVSVDFSKIQNGITIEELLREAGLELNDTTKKYSIEMSYSSTIQKDTLPNGTSKVENNGTYSRGDSSNSSGDTGTVSNELLAKSCDSANAKFTEISYTDASGNSIKEKVILIPWNCQIKVPSDATVDDVFQDTFFGNNGHLWITPEALSKNLKIKTADGQELSSENYTLSYITEENGSVVSSVGNQQKVLGYQIKFTEAGLNALKGKSATISYSLYGSYRDLYNGNNGTTVSRDYKNNAEYKGNSSSASYRYTGNYMEKKFVHSQWWASGDDVKKRLDELEGGTFKWRIDTKLSPEVVGESVTIKDYFPAGLNLTSLKLECNYGSNGSSSVLQKGEEGIISDGSHPLDFIYGNKTGTVTVVIETDTSDGADKGVRTISVTIPKEIIESAEIVNGGERKFNLDIEAEIPENSEIKDFKSGLEAISYTNRASLEVGDKTTNGDSNTVEVTQDKKRVHKTGIYDSKSRRMHYSLELNPKGEKLLNGKPLTLEDVLVYDPAYQTIPNAKSVDLVVDSVKAYYYAADDVKKEHKIDLPTKGYDFTYQYTETDIEGGKKQNKLTMQIPDGLHVFVEYEYQLDSDQDINGWKLDNTASLNGVDRGSDSSSSDVYYSTSSAGVSKNSVNFYKVDSENYGLLLKGAEFTLTVYDKDSHTWTAAALDNDGKGKITASGLKSNVLYCLKEIKAPSGYILPSDDEFYFYISEKLSVDKLDKPEGFTATIHELVGGNTIYIPNNSNQSISAVKEWKDGITPEAIDLTLYKGYAPGYTYKDTLGENPKLRQVGNDELGNGQTATITLQPNGTQTATWTGLPDTENGERVYYYVFETKAGKSSQIAAIDDDRYIVGKYLVSDTNNNGITHGEVILTNELKEVSAEKIWGEEATPVDIELTIYRGTEAGLTYNDIASGKLEKVSFSDGQNATITITAGSKGDAAKATWKKLDAADDTGNIYYYYVFETKAGSESNPNYTEEGGYQLGGFHVIYSKNGILYGNMTVTNEATAISVEKKWSDGAAHNNEEVKMQLYRSTTPPSQDSGAGKTTYNVEVYYRVANATDYTLLTNGSKTAKSQNINLKLGFYSPDVNKITVKSYDPDVTVFQNPSKDSSGNLIWKVKNITRNCKLYIDLPEYSNIWNYTITELPNTNSDFPENMEMVGDAVSLNSENGWKTQWKNLPMINAKGERLYYYVKEVESPNYEATYEYTRKPNGEIASVTVTNYPAQDDETNISVEKKWETQAPEGENVKVKLYRSVAKKNFHYVNFNVRFNNTVWKNLQYITSSDSIEYAVTLKYSWGADAYGNDVVLNGASAENGVVKLNESNIQSDVTIDLDFTTVQNYDNKWKVENGTLKNDDRLADMEIQCKDMILGDVELVQEVTLSASNNWKKSWNGLEKYDRNGNLYYYWVDESYCPAGYELKSSKNNEGISEGTITLTNAVSTTVNVTVNKTWNGYSGNEYDSYKVYVQLQKTNDDGTFEDVGIPVELTGTSTPPWSYTWEGLPVGFTYTVKEIRVVDAVGNKVNNFETTYSTSTESGTSNSAAAALTTSGTITVTNTKKSQGITLPGTGGKDGWIFYGLGIGFWAVSLGWLGLTFKKRKKSLSFQKEGHKGIP